MLLIHPPNKILGRTIETDFKKWLRFGAMWSSPLTLHEKCALTFLNILGEIPENQEKWLDEILLFYQCGEKENPVLPIPKERILDWKIDSPTIWADFKIYAGIDLDKENMHWWEFMALFKSLPENAAIRDKMSIRGLDLSKIKNSQTREEYRIRKIAVALDRQDYDDF